MIFRLEAVTEQTVCRYFLQVKKLTFKRTPGSHDAFPIDPTHDPLFLVRATRVHPRRLAVPEYSSTAIRIFKFVRWF